MSRAKLIRWNPNIIPLECYWAAEDKIPVHTAVCTLTVKDHTDFHKTQEQRSAHQ